MTFSNAVLGLCNDTSLNQDDKLEITETMYKLMTALSDNLLCGHTTDDFKQDVLAILKRDE